MINALSVLKRDLTRIVRARKTWAILIGIIVLPSMYAWVNIVAFWDPYGNTADVKVAVVNQDEGASSSLTGKLNVGEQVVQQLKTNDQLGWQFMDKDEAMRAVKSGDAYAAIVIPPHFSEDLLSITTGDFVQPELKYYTNEKANAIAPKITEVGASTLDTQVNSTFVSTVSQIIAQKLKHAGTQAGNTMVQSRDSTAAALGEADAKVQAARGGLASLQAALVSGNASIADAKSALQSVDATIGEVTSAVSQVQSLLADVQNDLVRFTDTVTNAYVSGAASLSNVSVKLQDNLTKVRIGSAKSVTAINGAERDVQAVLDAGKAALTKLQKLADSLSDGDPVKAQVERAIGALQQQNAADQALLTKLGTAKSEVAAISDRIETSADAIMTAVTNTQNSAESVRTVLTSTIPDLSRAMTAMSASAGGFSAALDSQRVLVGEAVGLLTGLETQLTRTGTALTALDGNLQDVQTDLGGLRTDLLAMSTADIMNKVGALTSLNPDQIAEFMSGPVQVHQNELFPVPAYGSAMAPLFTNLALWIAAFVLMVLLKLEVDTEGVSGLTVRQAYLGRWMLFAVINVLQSLLVSIGDVAIGVQTVNPVAFVATSVFIGLVYLSIIYALSVSFGYVGKGMVILLVIMQIPGASGIYPIEMMPGFFRALFPFFPFTYGIDAMREVIGGFYGGYYWRYVGMLLLFAALSFVLGIFLRQRLGNFARLFNRKLGETGLFVSEDVQVLGSRRRLTQLVQALTNHSKFRDQTARHAMWLNVNHKTLMRSALAVGLAGTVVLFVLGSLYPDAKATVLGLWGLLCFLVIAAVVAIEYVNQNIIYAAKVSEMPSKELERALAVEEAATRTDAPLELLRERGHGA